MAIENRCRELVDRKFEKSGETVNLTRVQESVGLNYSTVLRWYRNQVNRVDFDALDAWCKYLDCDVCDLLQRTK